MWSKGEFDAARLAGDCSTWQLILVPLGAQLKAAPELLLEVQASLLKNYSGGEVIDRSTPPR